MSRPGGWGGSYFEYHALDRMAQRVTPRGDSVYYGYDEASNLMALQYPRGTAAAYFWYDAAQRMEALLSPAGKTGYFAYDESSNLARKSFGNGSAACYDYDAAERVVSIRHVAADGTPLAYFDFGRDVAGRIVRLARESDLNVYYSYDAVDRMAAELWRRRSDDARIYGFWYDYDAVNNRTRMRREFGAGLEWDSSYFAYGADNALLRRRTFTPPATFADRYFYYDANGALRMQWDAGAADATYFWYGPHKLITGLKAPGEAASYFSYDAQLNRYAVSKAGVTRYYLWDGLELLEERDADGNLVARYTHGCARNPDIGTIAEVQRVANGTTYYQYLHMDHRGTVHKVTDAAGATQIEYTQDAFGRQLAPTGGANPAVPNDSIWQTNWQTFAFGGKTYLFSHNRVYDPETGLFLILQRPFTTCTWMSATITHYASRCTWSTVVVVLSKDFLNYPNKYRAFSNNPVGQVDRDGRASADGAGPTALTSDQFELYLAILRALSAGDADGALLLSRALETISGLPAPQSITIVGDTITAVYSGPMFGNHTLTFSRNDIKKKLAEFDNPTFQGQLQQAKRWLQDKIQQEVSLERDFPQAYWPDKVIEYKVVISGDTPSIELSNFSPKAEQMELEQRDMSRRFWLNQATWADYEQTLKQNSRLLGAIRADWESAGGFWGFFRRVRALEAAFWYSVENTITFGGLQRYDFAQAQLDLGTITLTQARSEARWAAWQAGFGVFLTLAPGASSFARGSFRLSFTSEGLAGGLGWASLSVESRMARLAYIRAFRSAGFRSAARDAGYTAEQMATLRGQLLEWSSTSRLRLELNPLLGGFATTERATISLPRALIGGRPLTRATSHELVHLLQQIRDRALSLEAAGQLSRQQIMQFEYEAFRIGTQSAGGIPGSYEAFMAWLSSVLH